MHLVIERGKKIDDQNVKNPWNWLWCEKVKVLSIKEKLSSSTWNGEDTITLMFVSTGIQITRYGIKKICMFE